jgi:hypothetical protein
MLPTLPSRTLSDKLLIEAMFHQYQQRTTRTSFIFSHRYKFRCCFLTLPAARAAIPLKVLNLGP